MATTVEVSPTEGPEGTVFTFIVNGVDLPSPPVRNPFTLNIEGPAGTAIGLGGIRKVNQEIRLDPTFSEDGEVGEWVVRLFASQDFFENGDKAEIVASAVFRVTAAN